MNATAPPELQYAPPLPLRRRRKFRRRLALIILLSCVASGVSWFRPLADWSRLVYWRHKCLSHAYPPNTSVYDGGVQFYVVNPRVSVVPAEWTNLYARVSPPGLKSFGTVFLHAMQTRSGRRRLVAVDIPERVASRRSMVDYDVLPLTWRVIDVDGPLRTPRLLNSGYATVSFPSADFLRVCGGSPSAADPSHFTFTYDANGQTYTADGWLRADDTVQIEARSN